MQRAKLKVEKRKILGKAVRKLRGEGFLPGNIYGKDIKSLAVQTKYEEFKEIFKGSGETGLIDLELDGESKPVLIHNVQFEPITKKPLHADFYQVNLKEKIKSMVPIEAIGEAKAVTEKIGLLMQTLSEIEVEALPEELPEKIEVDVKGLVAVNDQITVGDLKVSKSVSILTNPSQVVIKITELVSKEAEQQAAAEAEAAEAAKTEAAPAETTGDETKQETETQSKEDKKEIKEEKPQN